MQDKQAKMLLRAKHIRGRVAADMTPRRPLIGKQIIAHFGDGKWHLTDDIAARIGVPIDHVEATLRGIRGNKTYSCKAEFKTVGTKLAYRIYRVDNPISRSELLDKLTPIVSALEVQGRTNLATMSPPTVAVLAGRLRQLLDEWTERPHPHGTRSTVEQKQSRRRAPHEGSSVEKLDGPAGVPAAVVGNGAADASAGETLQGDDAVSDRASAEREPGQTSARES